MYTKALSSLLLLLELTSLATAAPYVEKRSFKVERVRNEAFTGRNGPRALAKAYRKYGMPLPNDLVDALETQEKNEILERRRTSKWSNPMEKSDDQVSVEQVGTESALDDILGSLLGNGNGNGNGEATGNGNRPPKGAGNGANNGANNNNGNINNGGGNRPTQGAGNGANNGENNNGGNRPAQGTGNGAANGANNGANNNGGNRGGQQGNGNGNSNGNGAGRGGKGSGNNNNNNNNNNGNQSPDMTDALAKARQGNQTGTVEAVPEKDDVEYLAQVKIGGQPITLDFDTGSSDLWVFNSQLPTAQTQGRQFFDPAKSRSFQMMAGAEFTIRYGDGSGATGNVGTDVVEVGGAVVPRQAVELATQVSGTFAKDVKNDGLMGLAFGTINAVKPQKQKTFFENVMPSLAEPLFTADLRASAPGAYEFGRVDASKFTGPMTWIPVNTTKGFWQFSSQSFAVNGGAPQQGARGGQAIADTGTTLLLADPSVVKGYYAQVPQAQNSKQMGGVVVPCDAKLPDLDLDIGGVYMARIKGADINFAPVGNGACFGGLQAAPAGGMAIYGDIMFKSQFVAFNGGNNTIGMAVHA
ncbi:hypothetical protein V2A60_002763 [Cordyceps javanica]